MTKSQYEALERTRESIASTGKRLLGWPELEPVFLLVLIGILSVFLVQTPSYRAETQLVPLVIGIPTMLLLVYLLFNSLLGDAADLDDGSVLDDVFELEELPDASRSRADEPSEPSLVEERIQIGIVFLWILGFLAIIYVAGFLPGIAVFMLLFNRYQFDFDPKMNVLYTALVWGVIYAIFSQLLNVRFHTGLFF